MKIIRLSDILSFGLAALVATGLALAASLTPQDGPVPAWRWAGMWLVAALFWLPLIIIPLTRWRYLRGARILAGARVLNRSGRPLDDERLASIIRDARVAWGLAFRSMDDRAVMAHRLANALIVVKENGFRVHGKPGRFAGYFMPTKAVILVGWAPDMRESALAHELGHFFLHATGRDASEESLREWATKFDLPY